LIAKYSRRGLLFLFVSSALAGCSADRNPVTPNEPTPSHWEMSLKMSSISAVEDCESTPGNPGDFRYTLKVSRRDEFDNKITIGTMGPHEMTVGDGSVLGATTEPLRFLMANEPGATFEVEYWLGEYDPGTDFEKHGWHNHTLDRDPDQMWAAGSSWISYNDSDPAERSGLLKFVVWSERDDCKGFANYYVTWKPVYE